MKVTVERKELLELLGKVKTVIPNRTTLPVLNSILFQVRSGWLWLTTTDLTVSLTGSCKATVAAGGGVAVKPKALETFLKAVGTDKVTLSSVGKDKLKVDAGNATTMVEGFGAKDYPPLPKVKGKEVRIVNLSGGLDHVDYAMANENGRPALEAVYFEPEGKRLNLTAADGFRLATTSIPLTGTMPKMLLPAKAVELLKRYGKNVIAVKATFQESKNYSYEEQKAGKKPRLGLAFFQLDHVALITQGIEATYPNYKQLIPTKGKALTVNTDDVKQALSVVMSGMDRLIDAHARLQTKGKELIVSYKSTDTQQLTQVKIAAKGKTKIAFNAYYLKDLLNKAGEQFTLKVTSPNAPAVCVSGKTTHVLMPIVIAEWAEKPKPVEPVPAPEPAPEKELAVV